MSGNSQLFAIDIAVIVIYLLAMLGVGVYFSLRNKSSDDYLLGGRRMPSWSVGLSLFASLLSTISFLAWPGEIIKHGPTIVCQVFAYPIIFFIVGRYLIPVIMQQRVTSAYEILETRLGAATRYLASTIFLTLRLLWMSVIVYATTEKVIVPVFHLPESAGPWIGLILCGITVAYSVLGGLRAVVATDVVQTFVLLSGAIGSLLLITYELGGVDAWLPNTWPEHWSTPRLWFHTDERSILGFMLSIVAWYVATAGSDQIAIQRYLATRDARTARRVLGTALAVEACTFVFMALVGLALLAWFTAHADWLGPGESVTGTPDRLFPRFLVHGLPPGVSGLIVAGMMAAAMSSLSSGINASASVIIADFIEGLFGWRLESSTRLRVAQVASAAVGIIVVVLALAVRRIDSNLYEVTVRVANLMTAPLFVLFFMAIFVRGATQVTAWIAAFTSVAVAVFISFFGQYHGLGFLWIVPLSLASGATAGMIATALVGRGDSQLRES